MSRNADQLLDEALQLPEEKRAEIAARLIESLDGEPDEGVDSAWAEEIARRCATLDSGEAIVTDWDTVRKRLELEIKGR